MSYTGTMTALLERPNQPRLARVTLSMFDALIAAGEISAESRVELLDGKIVEMEPMNTPHMNCVKDLYDRLNRQFVTRADVYAQSPIELPSDGRPQPDLCLIVSNAARADFARPKDIYLLLEVADSTIYTDREDKQRLYARDGIVEYWIVNLNKNQLEVYREPDGERYLQAQTLNLGQRIACLAFPDDFIDWQPTA
jgi:Uma2 family endonuclease